MHRSSIVTVIIVTFMYGCGNGVTSSINRLKRPRPVGMSVQEKLQVARGCRLFGVDRSVWLFAGLHGGIVVLLSVCRTDLQRRLSGASASGEGLLTADRAYIAFVVLCLTLHTLLFRRLYQSDPGWITSRGSASFAARAGTQQISCQYCGCCPPERSRHDHHTGQCIAKFDHFCPLLATSIGDCNHSAFWAYLLFESFLVLWAFAVAADAALPCVMGPAPSKEECWRERPAQSAALLLVAGLLVPCFNAFAGLTALHTYLAATAQTSYEICKGAQVPYLQPYYMTYKGPQHFGLLPKGLGALIREVRRGNYPPAPYSQGFANNLNIFFYAKKPYAYRRQIDASSMV